MKYSNTLNDNSSLYEKSQYLLIKTLCGKNVQVCIDNPEQWCQTLEQFDASNLLLRKSINNINIPMK